MLAIYQTKFLSSFHFLILHSLESALYNIAHSDLRLEIKGSLQRMLNTIIAF